MLEQRRDITDLTYLPDLGVAEDGLFDGTYECVRPRAPSKRFLLQRQTSSQALRDFVPTDIVDIWDIAPSEISRRK